MRQSRLEWKFRLFLGQCILAFPLLVGSGSILIKIRSNLFNKHWVRKTTTAGRMLIWRRNISTLYCSVHSTCFFWTFVQTWTLTNREFIEPGFDGGKNCCSDLNTENNTLMSTKTPSLRCRSRYSIHYTIQALDTTVLKFSSSTMFTEEKKISFFTSKDIQY